MTQKYNLLQIQYMFDTWKKMTKASLAASTDQYCLEKV